MLKEQFIDIGGQWSFIGEPEKSNGYGVILIGGSIAFVSDKSSDWHENTFKKRLFNSLLQEGYTIGYSNAHGANYGSDKAVQDIINLHQYMIKKTNIDYAIHLFAISMGGLLALRVIEKTNFVRSIALSQPLLNVRDQRKHDDDHIQKNRLDIVDPLGYAITSAHKIEYSCLDDYIEKVLSLDKLAKTDVPCKIWHGTGDENVPIQINAMPFVDIRIKNKLQIALEVEKGAGHDKEGVCYSDHKGIIQFFHKNE